MTSIVQFNRTAAAIVARTGDAYSFPTYGEGQWLACAKALLGRGYTEREAEAILRSKWTRWAADCAGTDSPGATDLMAFIDNPRNKITPTIVLELVCETFKA